MKFSFKDIDWRSVLLKRYKDYGLDETDVMVILVTDQIIKTDPDAPVTPETLAGYMTLPASEIDRSLYKLMDKKLISFTMENNISKFTLDNLFEKLFSDLKRDLVLYDSAGSSSKVENAYKFLEDTLGRTLSVLEVDRISSWLKEGADLAMIKSAVANLNSRHTRITFSKLNQEILRLEKEKDIESEGYTVRDDTNRDERKLNQLLTHNWLDDGNNKGD